MFKIVKSSLEDKNKYGETKLIKRIPKDNSKGSQNINIPEKWKYNLI